MRRLLIHRLHGSTMWSDYRPAVPPEPILLAVVGVAAIGTALAGFGGVFLGAIGVALLVPLVAAAIAVAWIRRYRRALQATILDAVAWRPDWHALDVGTGTGMLLIGAAHRVPDGRAVGIDLWRAHAGGGSADDLRRNARAEGVGDRIELVEGDALDLPFEEGTFDVVMASGAVHHIVRDRADFPRLIAGMTRILRPGGHILLWDVPHIAEIAGERLRDAGFETSRHPTAAFLGFANELLVARRAAVGASPAAASVGERQAVATGS